MKQEILERFDMLMANLKPIEPTVSFDAEFNKKFIIAQAEKISESRFDRVARVVIENIRFAVLPRVPAMTKALASAAALILIIGLFTYAIQPQSPVLVSREGIVLARGTMDREPKAIEKAYKFKTGDVITTKDASQIDIELPGKYAIRAKQNTSFKVAKLPTRYKKDTVIFELVEGQMLIDIQKGFKGSRFVVDTKTAHTEALGTKFTVGVSSKPKERTSVKVLEGKVEVKSRYKPKEFVIAKHTVVVGAGQKTEVAIGEMPRMPQKFIEEDWRQLEELYQIGRKPQVILLVTNRPDRAKQLLRPCPIYISDEEPRVIPAILEEAVLKIEEALKAKDKTKHLESIKLLEKIVNEHPNPKYDVQFLLYIGAYYNYLGYHQEAITTFKRVIEEYPDSPLASMALCAIGIIYEEKIKDQVEAYRVFKQVLERYPHSLEAIWVKEKLGNKKV